MINFMEKKSLLILSFLISIIFILLWSTPFIYPFKILIVGFHEIGHALSCYLTGGSVSRIVLENDESGFCEFSGGNKYIIVQAGYLGSLIIGCLLLILSKFQNIIKFISVIFWISIFLISFFHVKNLFGLSFLLIFSSLLIFLSFKLKKELSQFITMFIGTLSIIYSIWDIYSDSIQNNIIESDASVFASYLGLNSTVIGIFWIFISIISTYYTIKFLFK